MSEASRPARIAAIVLCAGRSSRTHPINKLLAPVDGVPLAAHVVRAALAAALSPVIVVTGHQDLELRSALATLPVRFQHNPHFGSGLASSLRAGLDALDDDIDGASICLGDMPRITAVPLLRLRDAFERSRHAKICVPVFGQQRGNPVLWPRWAFARLRNLSGDFGGRVLMDEFARSIERVAMPDDAVLIDADTPQALAELTRTT